MVPYLWEEWGRVSFLHRPFHSMRIYCVPPLTSAIHTAFWITTEMTCQALF